MKNGEIKYLEAKLQNLINLRSTFFALVITLTGGIASLLHNISILNTILITAGCLIDYVFINQIFRVTDQINKILEILKRL